MDHHLHTVAVAPRCPGPHARRGLQAPWLWLDSSVNGESCTKGTWHACPSAVPVQSPAEQTNCKKPRAGGGQYDVL